MLNRVNSLEEDDDEEEETKHLHQILDKFKTSNGIISIRHSITHSIVSLFIDDQDLGNTEQHLINIFNSDSNVCLICIESIGSKQAVRIEILIH